MKKKKMIKWIIITVAIIITSFLALCGYWVIEDLKQEEILKQEIINYSHKNLESDDFTVIVKTKGDYAYVEEAIKKYYKELSDNIKGMNKYLMDEDFMTLLAPSSLVNDRPNYSNSQNKLKTTKENLNKHLEAINNLCDENTIKNLIDKEKLEDYDYYYDFYLKLMYTKKDQEALQKLKEEMDTTLKKLNEFLDKAEEILVLLEKNDSIIQYENNSIYFNSTEALNEYNKLVGELQTMAKNFTITKNNPNPIKNSKVSEI
ncbi:MAG: hypothetical protein HFJ11_03355 [Bacilli bacterium]|nr:hypothetical protein [Bacilli bacterium]